MGCLSSRIQTNEDRLPQELFPHQSHQNKASNFPPQEFPLVQPSQSNPRVYDGPTRDFTLKEISDATKNFTSCLLGEGGFGQVFEGYIKANDSDSLIQVAIKRLRKDGVQGYIEWMHEVLVLSRVFHPNLIELIGYCNRNHEAILVYEFCHNGSLDQLLCNGLIREKVLSWRLRFKIALECSAGLSFLHQKNYIHRDFKSANILLTRNFDVKVTDFGLTRAGPEVGSEHVSTKVFGTPGYIDPDYMNSGKLTKFSDMYAFGVVLLELLTGRKPFESPDKSLANEMRPILELQPIPLDYFVDPLLRGKYEPKYFLSLATVAKHCITKSYARDTSMKFIHEQLQLLNDYL